MKCAEKQTHCMHCEIRHSVPEAFKGRLQADKTKVYQGVRVKRTVKELLQKQRALQSTIKTVRMKSPSFASQNNCVSTSLPGHYFHAFPADSSAHLRAFPPDSCVQVEHFDHPDLVGMEMPNETYTGGVNMHPTSSTQHWPQEHHSPIMDYYSHGMPPSSPSDSLNVQSQFDYNSYSPQESYSSSSSCYNSPTRMDSGYGLVPEHHYHYEQCTIQHCYCLSHWSGTQEGISTPDYAPYYGQTDLPDVEDTYFRRDFPSSEMCYI
ncbi:hypothetical protein DPEC_G00241600 [Dallia pectoralis]|uniref:Uncharacterized protein n=1 Tax=Dallia pectoralis TaxID=75939 RepID=A0ACC2FUX0_DALPE|nr:hypothetical protein DPEC_G00241600 [Dallia pectoralis]